MKHLKIGGVLRPIHFSVNALIEFEEMSGLEITNLDDRAKISTIKNIRALTFSGLKHGHKSETGVFPDFTVDQVGDWMTKKTMALVIDIFIEETSTGEESDEEEEEGDKKKQAGETSGQSLSAA